MCSSVLSNRAGYERHTWEISMVQRYSDVQFEFFGADGLESQRGVVIIRDGEMALEIECPDDRPYSIVGAVRNGFFVGQHRDLPDDVPVEAKWIRLDDIYIGTWVEDGQDYLFKFRLPADPTSARKLAHRRAEKSKLAV
jgi:hypothetical protein